MKNRVVKKVEKRMLVDKVCELQREICEHERFEGDLFIMLMKGEPQCVVEYNCNSDYTGWIWEKVRDLLKENKELAQKLKSYEEKQ